MTEGGEGGPPPFAPRWVCVGLRVGLTAPFYNDPSPQIPQANDGFEARCCPRRAVAAARLGAAAMGSAPRALMKTTEHLAGLPAEGDIDARQELRQHADGLSGQILASMPEWGRRIVPPAEPRDKVRAGRWASLAWRGGGLAQTHPGFAQVEPCLLPNADSPAHLSTRPRLRYHPPPKKNRWLQEPSPSKIVHACAGRWPPRARRLHLRPAGACSRPVPHSTR